MDDALKAAMERVETSYTLWPETVPRVEDVALVLNTLRSFTSPEMDAMMEAAKNWKRVWDQQDTVPIVESLNTQNDVMSAALTLGRSLSEGK